MATTISGLDDVRLALRATPTEARAVLRDVIATSTRIVTQRLQQAAPRETGALRQAITEAPPKGRSLNGFVTISGGMINGRQPASYVLAVEYGKNGRPFIRPTTERESGPFVARVQASGRTLERNLAAIGGRNL